jgi:hypothetical protein
MRNHETPLAQITFFPASTVEDGFEWKFTRQDLNILLNKIKLAAIEIEKQAA